jgi:hypothetical protein
VEVLAEELVLQHIVGVGIVLVVSYAGLIAHVVPGSLPDGMSLFVVHLILILRCIVLLAVSVLRSHPRHGPIHMPPDNMSGDPPIRLGIELIQHHKQQIETTQ